MTFGEKLKKMRIDNHLTQDELAEKIYTWTKLYGRL